ncbi:Uncharacterised protein [Brevundimonas vesicularis]|uniref:Uncharacterized protein n=1 Tax=Brevundimonas vesicularis TaxID=41276 RepID=A0A2X1BDC7_BREVE|nr:Uncharacterised protein [Brevundimonas vesicularis]
MEGFFKSHGHRGCAKSPFVSPLRFEPPPHDMGRRRCSAIIMPLVHPQRFQPLADLCPPSPIHGVKRPHNTPVSSHRRARLACDLAAARAEGTGAMVKSRRGAGADRPGNRPGVRSRVAGSRGILGRTGDRGSLLRPARRRLMGLGDKTATARRPELAGQPTARSVTPFVETVLTNSHSGRRPGTPPSPPNFAATARG